MNSISNTTTGSNFTDAISKGGMKIARNIVKLT